MKDFICMYGCISLLASLPVFIEEKPREGFAWFFFWPVIIIFLAISGLLRIAGVFDENE